MTDMKKKLETIRDMVKESMEAYDPSEEFGIDRDTYSQMIESVNGFFESMISRNDDSDFEYSEYSESDDESQEEPEYVDLLNNPDYEIVYEKHGWRFVKDFFRSILPLMKDEIMLWYSFFPKARAIITPSPTRPLVCC